MSYRYIDGEEVLEILACGFHVYVYLIGYADKKLIESNSLLIERS